MPTIIQQWQKFLGVNNFYIPTVIAGRSTGPSLTAVGATPTLPLVVGFFRLSVFLSCPTPGCLNIRLGARNTLEIASGLRGKIREISTYV